MTPSPAGTFSPASIKPRRFSSLPKKVTASFRDYTLASCPTRTLSLFSCSHRPRSSPHFSVRFPPSDSNCPVSLPFLFFPQHGPSYRAADVLARLAPIRRWSFRKRPRKDLLPIFFPRSFPFSVFFFTSRFPAPKPNDEQDKRERVRPRPPWENALPAA